MPELTDKKKEFQSIDPYLLLPTTWNQALVVYSELSNINGKRLTPEQRIEELEERYQNDPQFKDPLFLKALENGKKRI